MLGDFSGKSVLVTGASGGLGLHFARVLAAYGAHVVLGARRKTALEEASRGASPSRRKADMSFPR